VLLVPVGGGRTVDSSEGEVQLLRPAAPLGRALVDAVEGEEIELRLGGRVRAYELARVR